MDNTNEAETLPLDDDAFGIEERIKELRTSEEELDPQKAYDNCMRALVDFAALSLPKQNDEDLFTQLVADERLLIRAVAVQFGRSANDIEEEVGNQVRMGLRAGYANELDRIASLIIEATQDDDNMEEADEAMAALAQTTGFSANKVQRDVTTVVEARINDAVAE